jgi:hypothetical protein
VIISLPIGKGVAVWMLCSQFRVLDGYLDNKDKYMLFTGCEVRTEKIFSQIFTDRPKR